MKKILLLLIFSATTFASAQQINVVDVAVPGRPTYKHVYLTENADLFTYASNAVVSISSFAVENSMLTIGNDQYSMSNPLIVQAVERMNELGVYGLFFNIANGPSWDFQSGVERRWYLPDNMITEAALLEDPNWNFGPVTETVIVPVTEENPTGIINVEVNRWVFDNGCTRYEAALATNPGNEWTITWWRGERIRENFGGWLDVQSTSEGVVAAVNRHLPSQGECSTCINTDSPIDVKYALLNGGRGFSDYVEGVTDWVPSGLTNTIWIYQDANGNGLFDQITERNGNFILYKSVAGDAGGLPPATGTYECLADVVDALD